MEAKPWRILDIDFEDKVMEDLREEVASYRPLYLDHVNIMLSGPIGAGKSSFFNTINSTFQGHVTGQAQAGMAQASLTRTFRKYPVRRHRGGEPLKFRLCDTIGLHEDEMDSSEFKHILDGNLPDRFQFNLGQSITDTVAGYKRDPNLADRMHVNVMCIDAGSVSVMSGNIKDKLKKIRRLAAEREIPTLLVLTKIDQLCEHVEDDLRNVYNSKAVAEKVDEASNAFGIPKSYITVIKNYESETDCQSAVDVLSLTAMRQILRLADNYLDDQPDRLRLDARDHGEEAELTPETKNMKEHVTKRK